MNKPSVTRSSDDAATVEEGRLKEYRKEKLIVGECLLDLMKIAQQAKEDSRFEQIRHLAGQVAEDRFQLGVVGQFSRGKSTLMNAILGASYLPSGALPTTSVVTTVSYGNPTRATIRKSGE